MKVLKPTMLILLSLFLMCSRGVMSEETKKDKVELWQMDSYKIEDLLPKKEQEKRGFLVIEYFPQKEKGVMHFLYNEKKITISIRKIGDFKFLLSYKNNKIYLYLKEDLSHDRLYLYFFLSNETDKRNVENRMRKSYDGVYRKKSEEKLDSMISRLRQQYEFDLQEEEAFKKDPPSMMKGGE